MSIEWFRDLTIGILGIGLTVAAIFIAVLVFLLYRKISTILDSVKATTRTIRNISSTMEEEISSPLARVASLAQGISQAINLFSRFSDRKKGGR